MSVAACEVGGPVHIDLSQSITEFGLHGQQPGTHLVA